MSAAIPRQQEQLDRLRSRAVMISTPIARAPVWRYTIALAETCVTLNQIGIRFHYNSFVGSSNLPMVRNVLVARFLASDATHLMFIDDDIGWNQDDVLRLLASEQRLIAGAYRKRSGIPQDIAGWAVQPLSEPQPSQLEDTGGNIEVARVATGFMCIERSVFEALIRVHPEWKGSHSANLTPAEQPFYYRFFAYDEELTEDYVFCDRWRAIGGRIFIDPSLTLSHYGETAYTGSIVDVLSA